MPKCLKIGAAAFIVLVAVASSGAVWLRRRIQTPEYCSSCHIMTPYYNSWKSSMFPAYTHEQAGMICQDCHQVTMAKAIHDIVANVTKSYQLPLKEQEVRPVDCFRCHTSYAELAEATRDLKGPDGFPLGRNPHTSHWGALECGTCHKMHRTSRDWCSECHGLQRTSPAWNETAAAVSANVGGKAGLIVP